MLNYGPHETRERATVITSLGTIDDAMHRGRITYHRSQLSKAAAIARAVHHEQRDDGGNDYLQHIASVVNIVAVAKSFEATLVACMHDVLEDCANDAWMLNWVMRQHFPNTVSKAVVALTRLHRETYEQHIERVIVGGYIPVVVKLAELEDNLVEVRLGDYMTPLQLRKMQMYRAAHERLLRALAPLIYARADEPLDTLAGVVGRMTASTEGAGNV